MLGHAHPQAGRDHGDGGEEDGRVRTQGLARKQRPATEGGPEEEQDLPSQRIENGVGVPGAGTVQPQACTPA